MTTAYTSLLGLALPVDGELTGTWGQVVNNYITTYLDGAIAGTQIISGSQTAVTLSKTTGTALIQVGSGATGSSQYQVIKCSGAPASLLTVTVPSAEKTYLVINATSTSQSVKIVGASGTGVTITSGKTSIVAWNGSDFVEITPSTISSTLPVATGGTGATTLTGVLKGNGTSAFTAATSGTDYSAGTSALATGILKSTTTTGALTIAVAADFPTLNQNTTGTAAGLSATLAIASGGTNSTATPTAGGAGYGTGTAHAYTAAGTAGQVLTSQGAGAPTWTTLTSSGGTVTSVAALTLGTTGTDVSSSVANSTTTPVITLNIPTASASNRGALSSTDWTTFNDKLSTAGGTMTGAITFAAGQSFTGTVSTGKSIAMAMIFGF